MSLVLSRKNNESVLIDGNILVTVRKTFDGQVKLIFDAPNEVHIVRTELLDTDAISCSPKYPQKDC